MKGLRVSQTRIIKNPEDALHYCLCECKDFHLGCAVDCRIRRHFGIPPHSKKYPQKEAKQDKPFLEQKAYPKQAEIGRSE